MAAAGASSYFVMAMRGAPRRRTGDTMLVSRESFSWPHATIATLRHSTLPWYDVAGPPFALAATPVAELRDLGARDRLSLVAQFAAHQAFLQFAGLADGGFDRAEWAVVRKRGSDCRLLRVAAQAADIAAAPPVLALIHDFAAAVAGPELEVFRQSWARAENVYAEASAALRKDATADLRWMRRSAAGEVVSPGPDVLREIWSGGNARLEYDDEAIVETLTRLGGLDDTRRVVHLSSEFPLLRYGALTTIDASLPGSDIVEATVAERIAARLGESPHVVIVGRKLDLASQRAIEIASALDSAAWLFPKEGCDTPPTRWFAITPR